MKWCPRPALLILLLLVSFTLVSCKPKIPTISEIRDSPLLDPRIEETPRQKVLRECKQESSHFRVSCTHCHATGQETEIKAPNHLQLNAVGKRAQIMRKSPSFGLHQQCSVCHQSKFTLTLHAKQLFGPRGAKRKEMERELEGKALK